MPIKKLMRCSSSGKLMRDDATGKLMVYNRYSANDCEYCNAGETPLKLRVTFSGISVCGCDYSSGYFDGDSGVNATYILDQHATSYCRWEYTAPDIEERIKFCTYEGGPGCTGEETCVHKEVIIRVTRTATKVNIQYTQTRISIYNIFEGLDLTPDSGCVNLTSAPNDNEAGDCYVGLVIGTGGTVSITEL